ncbi:MAG TPA: hypothetical protein PKE29_16480 [Phycisphaerales bacterium]|nr:hypothetical protein [Phycisphaerales bacterium]
MRVSSMVVASGLAIAAVTADAGAFTSFIIRNGAGNVPPQILPNNAYVPGATEFVISAGSMKAGWGSSAADGSTLGSISELCITRHDDSGRFTAGSGPAVAPYFNIWITDGANFAVVANEPSNPSFAAFRTPTVNGGFTYDFSMNDIATEPAKIYETINGGTNNTWVHAALGKTGLPLTFADVLGFTVQAPSAAYITAGGNGVGSGAPRELGTNTAYGVNWVFGDTLSNYVSGAEGYVVSNPSLVPTPGAIALLGLGGLAAVRRRRH